MPARLAAGTANQISFDQPVVLPRSVGVTEPRVAFTAVGTMYVTGPTGTSVSDARAASPVWKSTDGGRTFAGPVQASTAGTTLDRPFGGAASDIAIDAAASGADHVVVISAWTASTSVSQSLDSGQTWAGVPFGHVRPIDDRPWLTSGPWCPAAGVCLPAMYMVWDGLDGIHVSTGIHSLSPTLMLDTVAVPEEPLTQLPGTGTDLTGAPVRECTLATPPDVDATRVCASGPIMVDGSNNLWFAYVQQPTPSQGAIGIATSTDFGRTWSRMSVPGSGSVRDPATARFIFPVVQSDREGNMYVVWSEAPQARGVPQVYYSWLPQGTSTWHTPVRVSTTRTAVFGTLAVPSSGVVDVAYYGTDDEAVRPQDAADGTRWSVYVARSSDALHGDGFATTRAVGPIHRGSLCVFDTLCGSGGASLGTFFSIAVDPADGNARILTAIDGLGVVCIRQHESTVVVTAPRPVALNAPLPPPGAPFPGGLNASGMPIPPAVRAQGTTAIPPLASPSHGERSVVRVARTHQGLGSPLHGPPEGSAASVTRAVVTATLIFLSLGAFGIASRRLLS